MSRSASRIVRLRTSSQRWSSARRSDCAGSGCSAASVFSRHPSSSNATCRLSATPSRNRSNASDRRAFSCSTAAAGSTGNPVRAQNASRTPLPPLGGEEERLEPAEVLRAIDGEVAGLDLVADLEEQRALPAAAVRHAVMADERVQRRRGEVERRMGRNAAAPRRAVFAVGPQCRQRRRRPPRPARRRTSSCSETARRTGSARRAARPSARSGPCGRPASSSPGRTGPRAAAPRARLTAAGPAARRRRRRGSSSTAPSWR